MRIAIVVMLLALVVTECLSPDYFGMSRAQRVDACVKDTQSSGASITECWKLIPREDLARMRADIS